VWPGEDLRPGPDKGNQLALKVYGYGERPATRENLGNKEMEVMLLKEAKAEILNLRYLQDRHPSIAVCFPLFHCTCAWSVPLASDDTMGSIYTSVDLA
jgi:hypothetical protein